MRPSLNLSEWRTGPSDVVPPALDAVGQQALNCTPMLGPYERAVDRDGWDVVVVEAGRQEHDHEDEIRRM